MTKHDKARRTRFGKALRKIFIAVPIGVTTYYITNMTNQPQIWGLTISILIGGFTLAIQFLNDYEKHMMSFASKLDDLVDEQVRNLDEIQTLIKDGFARTNEVTELFRAVEASSLRTDAITQLVQNSTQISPGAPPLVNEFAEWQINRTSQFLKELGEGGVISQDGEDREWLLSLTMQSQHTIDATSLCTVDGGGTGFQGGLWTSEFGQHFLEFQRNAMSRGVTIRRIFILDGIEQTRDSDFIDIYYQHNKLGIKVKVMDRATIPQTLKNLLFDFVVFDDAISYEVTPSSSCVEEIMRPTIVKTNLALQPHRVRERKRRFEELWNCAEDLE